MCFGVIWWFLLICSLQKTHRNLLSFPLESSGPVPNDPPMEATERPILCRAVTLKTFIAVIVDDGGQRVFCVLPPRAFLPFCSRWSWCSHAPSSLRALELNQSRPRRSEASASLALGWKEPEGWVRWSRGSGNRMKASPAVMETRLLLLVGRNE